MKDLFSLTADDLLGAVGASPSAPAEPATPGAAAPAAGHDLFDSLLWQESRGHQTNPDGTPVTSKKGAIGIAQVMPDTAPEAARLAGLPYDEVKYRTDAGYNKALGRAYYNKQLQDFGDEAKALAAYNGGPGALRRALSRAGQAGTPEAWLRFMPTETQAYVPSIIARHNKQRGSAAAGVQQPTDTAASGEGKAYYTPDQTHYSAYQDPGPGPSTLDYFKEVLASAVDSVGSAAQGVGEVGAAAANKFTESQAFEGFNPLTPAADAVRNTMTPAGQSARTDGFQGDVLDPATWQLPSSHEGWLMAAANGFGSMAATILPVIGQSGKAASLARAAEAAAKAGNAVKATELAAAARSASAGSMAIGAGANAAVTGGAAAQDVRQSAEQSIAGMSHAELMANVPVYAQIFQETGDEQQARSGVVNRAAQLSGAFSAAFGAVGGAFNARVLEDFIAHKGMAKMLGDSVGSRLGRTAIGGGVGHVAEGFQETSEKVGQNVGENIALGRDPLDNATRDSLGDFAGGAMVGGGAGAIAGATTGHAAGKPVPPGMEKVAEKAAQSDTPLSKAALAGNTGPLAETARAVGEAQVSAEAAQAGAVQQAEAKVQADQKQILDDQAQRSADIAQALRQKGALQKLRADDSPVKVQDVLKDLALARSPSTDPGKRETALARLEIALEWAGVKTASQQAVAQPTADQHVYDDAEPAKARAAAAAQQQTSNEEAAGKLPEAPDVDQVIETLKIEPALRTATQTALVKQAESRYQPEDMELLRQSATYAAGMSATQKLRVQQLRGVANPAAVVGRDAGKKVAEHLKTPAAFATAVSKGQKMTSPEEVQYYQNNAKDIEAELQKLTPKPTLEQVPAHKGPAPAGQGSAVFRKRRAQLRQLIDLGMNGVGFEGNSNGTGRSYYLTDGKRRFALDGPADAQLARAELHAKIREGANQANTNPTDAQKVAGNYKKGRVDFDGLKLGIENPVGSTRSSKATDPNKWSVQMTAHYGDLTGTKGADGDAIDIYLPDNARTGSPVFVVDQYGDDGKFDEHKAVLGVGTEAEAAKIYDAHFSDGSGPKRRRAITKMTVSEFDAWAHSPAATKPAAGDKSGAPGHNAPADTAGARRADPVVDRGVDAGRSVGSGPDDPSVGAERSGGKDGAVDHGGERAYVAVKVRGHKKMLPVIDVTKLGSPAREGNHVHVGGETATLLQAVAQVFGKKVVFVQDESGEIGDGFVKADDSKTIYLNERSSIQPMAVFGHELMHLLKREMPEVHAAISKIVRERIKAGGNEAFRKDYDGNDAVASDAPLSDAELEELTSDLGGVLMSDPKFWREVVDQVQREHPEQANGMLAKLAEHLLNAIDRLVEIIRGIKQPGFNAKAYVDDLGSIRAAVSEGLAQYAASKVMAEKQQPGAEARRSTQRSAEERELIELRKQISVLDSIEGCLG